MPRAVMVSMHHPAPQQTSRGERDRQNATGPTKRWGLDPSAAPRFSGTVRRRQWDRPLDRSRQQGPPQANRLAHEILATHIA